MTATNAQIARTANEWSRIANEPITVEQIGVALYTFASELATLRLLKQYRNAAAADCGYSENMERFFFRIEL